MLCATTFIQLLCLYECEPADLADRDDEFGPSCALSDGRLFLVNKNNHYAHGFQWKDDTYVRVMNRKKPSPPYNVIF